MQSRFIGESSSQDHSNKQDKFVEFEDEETIIGYLTTESKKLDVICITGMPGVGKTTLAMKVYEHRSIVDEIPWRFRICATQRFNRRDVFLYILKTFTPKVSSTPPSDQELISTVAACLRDKKFLIVVDDLWRVEDWDVIKEILPMNNGQAKVLVTSRNNGFAGISDRHVHINGLGPKASLKLLKLKVFGLENCPPQLEDVLQVIANSCGEVPLIIHVIGGILKGILRKKESIIATKEEWYKIVSKNVNEIIKTDERKSIQDALQLSYDRLDGELRVCFLYTGLFPEDQEIPASTLTKLWIAEGFIQRKDDGHSIEESATKVLDDLIDNNLLMVSKKNLDQVKTCLVRDMIRGFCIAKAAEENFFRVIKASSEGNFEPRVSEIGDFRRLSLHSNPSRFLSENPSGPHVRSFLCFFKEDLDLDPSHISTIPNSFNLLRILNFKSIKFSEFPELTRLILLKHITVSVDNLNVLPKRISKLLNLESLIVDTNSTSITMKANIWKMTRLRRLKTKAAISLDPSKKGKSRVCEDLETISRLSPDSCTATLSERAPRLKTLGIRGKVGNLFDTFPLERFRHLEKLKIVNDLVYESASERPLLFLPQLDRFPPNLNRLTLSKTYLQWSRHMPILASINTLKILKLKDNAFTGKSWRAEGAGFQQLQFLLVENIEYLVEWTASSTHFPNLRWLVIRRCQSIQQVPDGVAANLEKLEIEHVNRLVVASAKRIAAAKEQAEQNQQSPFSVPFKLTIGSGCYY